MTEELKVSFDEQEMDKILSGFDSTNPALRHESTKAFYNLYKENAVLKAQLQQNQNDTNPKITKEEILAIKDDVKRRKAIAENMHLFKRGTR